MSICSSLPYLASPSLTSPLLFVPASQSTIDPSMHSHTQQSHTFWYLCYDITHYLFIHSSLHLNCHPDNSDDGMNDNFSPINCNGASDAMRRVIITLLPSSYNNIHRLHRSGRIKRRPAGRISSTTHWIILKIGDDYYRTTTSTSLSFILLHPLHSFTRLRCYSLHHIQRDIQFFPLADHLPVCSAILSYTKPTPCTSHSDNIIEIRKRG